MIGTSLCLARPIMPSIIAVICGTPMPATTRVVQIEPGPMPIFTPSAPAAIKAATPSAVATLPAIISMSLVALLCFRVFIIWITASLWPCAVSTTSTSAPAATAASARAKASLATPKAAPTRRHLLASLFELGYDSFFSKSLRVTMAVNFPLFSTRHKMESFLRRIISLARCKLVLLGATTKSFNFVINSRTLRPLSSGQK